MKRNSVNKKQREEEQQAIGAIYKQYIDTFQETGEIPGKTFVKSDTLYGDHSCKSSDKGQLYAPKPIIKLKKEDSAKPVNPLVEKKGAKRKSNLKSLGDELKMLQHERQTKEVKFLVPKSQLVSCQDEYSTSTNLFVSNLNPNVTESNLIEIFGVFGALASVKIMWPRNDLNSRTANCGFVAFMSRSDAERALNSLKNNQDMRINWGKSVKLPPHPIHIPPELYKLYSPPPPSGLPFNAQNHNADLSQTVVKVTVPFDRNLLMLIHRMVEFVVREGPEFEAIIMNMERGNPEFSFLHEYQNPAHTYYRWKLFSILNGDPKNSWGMKPFRMYKEGSIWVPPTAPDYKQGMPRDLITREKEAKLTESQVSELVSSIKNLAVSRKSIARVMIFCLGFPAVGDVLDVVMDSLKNSETNPVKKIARLYLLSDLAYNYKIKKNKLERFTGSEDLLAIFEQFHRVYKKMKHSQDRDCLRTKIFMVLRAWVFHHLQESKFVAKLENVFLHGSEAGEDEDELNEPLDGASLLKRSLQTSSNDCTIVKNVDIFG